MATGAPSGLRSAASKFVLILLIVLSIGLPLLKWEELALCMILIAACIPCQIFLSKMRIALILMLLAAKALVPYPYIQEGFNIFLPKNAQDSFYDAFLPPMVVNDLKSGLDQSYPPDKRCSEETAHCWRYQVSSKPKLDLPNEMTLSFWDSRTPYARSADALFQRNVTYSRKIKLLHYENTGQSRLGFVNAVAKYPGHPQTNWHPETSEMRREHMPRYHVFDIPSSQVGRPLCWRGNLYIDDGSGYNRQTSKVRECIELQEAVLANPIYLASTTGHNLMIKVGKSWYQMIIDKLILLLTAIALALCMSMCSLGVVKSLVLAGGGMGLFAATFRPETLSMMSFYPIFPWGTDMITHEGLGRAMLYHLLDGNLYEYLRGGESAFYFMPGLRYLISFERLIFGDGMVGKFIYLVALVVALLVVWRRLLPMSAAILLAAAMFFEVTFVRLFFVDLSFLRNLVSLAEIPGAACFLAGLAILLRRNISSRWLAVSGLALALSIFLRPNYSPAVAFLLIAMTINLWRHRAFKPWLCLSAGFAPILLVPLHNLYFGHFPALFTSSAAIPANLRAPPGLYWAAILHWLNIVPNSDIADYILNHLAQWSAISPIDNWLKGEWEAHVLGWTEVVRISMFLLLPLCLRWALHRRHFDILLVSGAAICSHLVLFFFHPDHRYALLAWLLTPIPILAALHRGLFANILDIGERQLQFWTMSFLDRLVGYNRLDVFPYYRHLEQMANLMNLPFLQRLKFVYRPFICPFHSIADLVNPSDRVLDIGCGRGMALSILGRFRQVRTVMGLECSESLVYDSQRLLRQPESGFENVDIRYYDGQSIPTFDIKPTKLLMIDVLHHIPPDEWETYFQNLYQVMPDDAELIIKDIDGSVPFYAMINKLHDLVISSEVGTEPEPDALVATLQRLGFRCETLFHTRMIFYGHFALRVKKRPDLRPTTYRPEEEGAPCYAT